MKIKLFALTTAAMLAASTAYPATIRTGSLFAGNSSGSFVDITSTGDLAGGDLSIGSGSSSGTLEVNADNSPNTVTTITNVDDLRVGTRNATGSLRVVGDGTAGSARVEVQDDFRLNANADSSLSIENGGEIIYSSPPTGRGGTVIIGSFADFIPGTGNTTTTVTGPGSYFEINGRLELGFNNGLGSDDMTISNGARVVVKEPDDFAERAAAASDPSENTRGSVSIGGDFEFGMNQALDTLTIAGTGSELVFSSSLFTSSGNNRIVVTDGGAIRQNETGDIEAAAAFFNRDPDAFFGISLGSALGESSMLVDGAASTVSATRNISIGAGDVFTGFDNGDSTKPLFGPSTADITVSNGALVSTTKDIEISVSDETGTGFLVVESGGRVEATNIRVNDGGVLSGDGGTVAANVILNGGTIAPGASPGTMTIEGNLEVLNGLLEFEVGGTDAGTFDQLFVTGDMLTPNGLSIAITFLDGFTPQSGDEFDFFNITGNAAIFDTPEEISVSVLGIDPTDFSLAIGQNGFSGTFTGDDTTVPVPVPAGLPLLLTAVGALRLVSRKQRNKSRL
ncbi:MAG: VPLPA-CTERM sorting domain-containing protein [Roseovarius sp.]|jgi:T5SS/PEP-CTERM-associated repeat protein|uniref:VPLPA-CTERM sorting domain-containing protein n=1 Tax=Roseovarius sp. TaxID=1486281 RepID=UPI0032EF44D5